MNRNVRVTSTDGHTAVYTSMRALERSGLITAAESRRAGQQIFNQGVGRANVRGLLIEAVIGDVSSVVRAPRRTGVARAVRAHARTLTTEDEFTFGVEIECIMPSRWTRSDLSIVLTDEVATSGYLWRITHDGSVSGMGQGIEYVSPILKGREGLASVERVMNHISSLGGTVNHTCGMHVHIGVRHLKASQIAAIAKSYIDHEAVLDSLLDTSRRGDANRYCHSHQHVNRANLARLATSRCTVRQVAEAINFGYQPSSRYSHHRYYKVNLQPFVRYGTIEFRAHEGCLDPAKAKRWILTLLNICASAVNGVEPAMITNLYPTTTAVAA